MKSAKNLKSIEIQLTGNFNKNAVIGGVGIAFIITDGVPSNSIKTVNTIRR